MFSTILTFLFIYWLGSMLTAAAISFSTYPRKDFPEGSMILILIWPLAWVVFLMAFLGEILRQLIK